MVRHFEVDADSPRLPRKFKVGVFPFSDSKPHRFNAYTLTYNPQWPGCCEHTVEATNGTEAKRLAIQEHKDRCLTQKNELTAS